MENIELKVDKHNIYEDFNIAEEITKDTIKNVVIQQSDDIEYPMVCINCSVHNKVNQFALDGLKCILESCKDYENKDELPVYMQTKDSLIELGRGSYNKLYRYLDTFVKTCMNEKVKVYKFNSLYERERIDKSDPTKVVLNL